MPQVHRTSPRPQSQSVPLLLSSFSAVLPTEKAHPRLHCHCMLQSCIDPLSAIFCDTHCSGVVRSMIVSVQLTLCSPSIGRSGALKKLRSSLEMADVPSSCGLVWSFLCQNLLLLFQKFCDCLCNGSALSGMLSLQYDCKGAEDCLDPPSAVFAL